MEAGIIYSDKKKPTHTLEFSHMLIDSILNDLDSSGKTYRHTITNYTSLIEAENRNYYFLKHFRDGKVLSTFKELKQQIGVSLVDIENIDPYSMKYYTINQKSTPFFFENAYNIDITSAYPTCLLNSKLIDKKMFDKLMNLFKPERLACIGMLASHKLTYTINSGEVIDFSEYRSPYSKYFFHCVQSITGLMWNCEIVSGLDYIFCWVDSIYVITKDAANKCRKTIKQAGYKCTVDKVTDLQYIPMEDKTKIILTKDGENKLFHIPIQENRIAKLLKRLHK